MKQASLFGTLFCCALLLAGCATTSSDEPTVPSSPAAATPAPAPLPAPPAPQPAQPSPALPSLAPPAALTLNNVPEIPGALVARVGRYTEFSGHRLLDWSGAQGLLVSHRSGSRVQLHRVQSAGSAPLQVTQGNEPTYSGRFLPQSNALLFARDSGGNEATQLFRLDLQSGTETRLTQGPRRYALGPFNRARTEVVMTSLPLDAAAPRGNAEQNPTGVQTEFAWLDPATGSQRAIATLPGTGWYATDVHSNGRVVLLTRFISSTESEIWALDVPSGKRRRLLPREGEAAAAYGDALYARDEDHLYLLSDHAGEFRQLYRYNPWQHRFDALTADLPWDVSALTVTDDRTRLAYLSNQQGRGVPHVLNTLNMKPLALPPVEGSVTQLRLAPEGSSLAMTVDSNGMPASVAVINLGNQESVWWARADTAGLETSQFRPTEAIAWKSFDGRSIPGLITRPPQRFSGKRPVLIDVHGGPAAQASVGFKGRANYLVNELGLALIEPNVRGSAGFGKTFVALDDGQRREDAVKDIGALLDWIAQQPDLDASRVMIQGASYGGYVALAAAARYSDRLRGAISIVGISNFVSFLERTESYRRDLRRAEYGDERDPVVRAFLTRISPTTNAARIKVPLLVMHGRNDPRVPVSEAERIIAIVSGKGVPVWSVIAANEGHGFAKKENADYAFYTRVSFIERFLLDQ